MAVNAVNGVLKVFPPAANTDELDLATGLVNYVMRDYIRHWRHPLTPENGSKQFTAPIRMVIRQLLFRNCEEYKSRFDEVFSADHLKTPRNYCDFMNNKLCKFDREQYSHGLFLNFCAEISSYAKYMHRYLSKSPDFAVTCIVLAIWPVSYCNEVPVVRVVSWKTLDGFCKTVREGEIVHPIVEYYPWMKDSPELDFAIDVVTIMARYDIPGYTHPMRLKPFSDGLRRSILTEIEYLRCKNFEKYKNYFNENFIDKDMRIINEYVSCLQQLEVHLREEIYTHDRILKFCVLVSMSALHLKSDDLPDILDLAITCIVHALWPLRSYWNHDGFPFDVRMQHLRAHCSRAQARRESDRKVFMKLLHVKRILF